MSLNYKLAKQRISEILNQPNYIHAVFKHHSIFLLLEQNFQTYLNKSASNLESEFTANRKKEKSLFLFSFDDKIEIADFFPQVGLKLEMVMRRK